MGPPMPALSPLLLATPIVDDHPITITVIRSMTITPKNPTAEDL